MTQATQPPPGSIRTGPGSALGPSVRQRARHALKQCLFSLYLHGGCLQIRNAWQRMCRRPRIVIIYYHRVGPCDRLSIPLEFFRAQLAYLHRHYDCLTLHDLAMTLRAHESRSRPIAVVTFDDGYRDNFTHAFPALLAAKVPATFFVSTGFVGTDRVFPHDQRALSAGRAERDNWPKLTWDDLRQMQSAGMEIGSHTVSHANLGRVTPEVAQAEIQQSLAMLRQELGDAPRAFGIPWGQPDDFNEPAIAAMRAAGYYAAVTTIPRAVDQADDLFHLPRVDAGNGTMTHLATLAAVEGIGSLARMWRH